MHIIFSDIITYCGGVDRALKMTENALKNAKPPVYSLGQLIHNHEVCSMLEAKGLAIISSPEEAKPGTVIIRAHGVGDSTREAFINAGFTLCDATCPIVQHNLDEIRRLAGSYRIVIIGDKQHDEVRSMCGVNGVSATVIERVEDLVSLAQGQSYAVFVQTTFSQDRYEAICEAMRQQGYCFIEANKVCSSPIKREKAVLRLAQRCDAVIIVGGKNSANTKMLADLAATSGKPVWHIENAQEVNDEMRSFGTIGIASGTSTSMETILRVKAKLLGRLREDRKKPIS